MRTARPASLVVAPLPGPGIWSFPPRRVAHIADLEAEPAQHPGGAVDAAAEVVCAEWHAGGELVSHPGDGLGVVAAAVVDEQVGGGAAEPVLGEELVLAQPVVFADGAADIGAGDPAQDAPVLCNDGGLRAGGSADRAPMSAGCASCRVVAG